MLPKEQIYIFTALISIPIHMAKFHNCILVTKKTSIVANYYFTIPKSLLNFSFVSIFNQFKKTK